MTLVKTAGVHGYSSPCPNHVIFSMREDVYKLLVECDAFWLMVGEEFIEGSGAWYGDEERAFALPQELFNAVVFRWPVILADQDAIIELGTPQARNWRPATLVWIKKGEREDLGVWRSVTEEDAKLHDSWSFFNDHYFICEVDPPANMFEAEQREVAKKLAALDSILKTINQHFDTDLLDYKAVADGLDANLNRMYDDAFISGAEHMSIVLGGAANADLDDMRTQLQKNGKLFVNVGGGEDASD
jgi:hypothetical protein